MSRIACAVLSVVVTAACGHPSGEPARFSGTKGGGVLTSGAVREVAVRPAGYASLGRIVARCWAAGTSAEVDEEWLGDVDCAPDRLRAEIYEKAARVGGELLVGLACATDPARPEEGADFAVTCSAAVAGHPKKRGKSARSPGPAAGEALDGVGRPEFPFERPSDAWRIRVTAHPANAGNRPHAPIETDRVNEHAFLPVSHHVVADVVAGCPDGCERRAARYAVRAGAGRVGATDVVGIACIRESEGWLCTGRAARPEVAPEQELRAR